MTEGASSTSEVQNILRIDQLQLTNFRCFAECEVDFHPSLTVLVAENAKGKSAILDAVSMSLDPIVATLDRGKMSGFPSGTIHLSKDREGKMEALLPVIIKAKGCIGGKDDVEWTRELRKFSKRSRPSTKYLKEAISATQQLSISEKVTNNLILPVVAYYRTDRLWNSKAGDNSRGSAGKLPGRHAGYFGWASPSSSFGVFVDWYRTAFNDLGTSTSKFRDKDNRLEKQLAAIHQAIATSLEPTGWQSIAWQAKPQGEQVELFESDYLAVEHVTKGKLPLQFLSDGVKNMISLVADLSYRCVRLNPELGIDASARTPGVVLIDEIDMHLHPRWQQVVIQLLTSAFPQVQFIMTTHSPQVLSTVDYESIRLIRLDGSKGVVKPPEHQTKGIESADILARLMDVDPVPRIQESGWLSDYRALLQTSRHETKEGKVLWSKIVEHFGQSNPVLEEFETLRRFSAFRQAHGLKGTEGGSDA